MVLAYPTEWTGSTGWRWTARPSVTALLDDPGRLAPVTGLGVDEHAWQRANARRHTVYATGVVGFRPGAPARLLEVVQGRSGKVYGLRRLARRTSELVA
jgi:hypothetical protein